MNIEKLFSNKEYLQKELQFFLTKKQIKKIEENKELVIAYLKKARHNFSFYKLNKENHNYHDWLIVTLYYSLYHCALALITHKNYSSKNHYATILILINEYAISIEEALLINELSINKQDAELYTNLKTDRHDASYATETKFTKDKILNYEQKVANFINKAEEIISK